MRASLACRGSAHRPEVPPRPHRPEIFLLCDISGSMATFARFTLQFTYAMATQFSKLRSFVFVDAVDEVTDYLKPGPTSWRRWDASAPRPTSCGSTATPTTATPSSSSSARYGREITPVDDHHRR
jgi:uncharacterized protein with von Willebrand factor type A (vWA) domain